MQQMSPPPGRHFPDNPQPASAPLFASNAPQGGSQGYEPQQRMQHTGAVPVLQTPQYTTGQLRTLHSTLPVSQMPPHSAYPANQVPMAQPAPAYQPRHAVPQQEQLQQTQQVEGTPLMVRTVQGVAVAVTAEAMQAALAEHEKKAGKSRRRKPRQEQQQAEEQTGKQKGRQKKEIRGKQKREGRFVMKFSVAWCIFGVIGVISTIMWLLEWVIIPLLVYLNTLTGGAA